MYAIIEACGRQYKVQEGDKVFFEKLQEKEGDKVVFDKVVLISGDKQEIGTPYVKNAKVEGKVVAHTKGKKIVVFKYRPKKGSKTKKGHRQNYTQVEITKISFTGAKETNKEVTKETKQEIKEVKTEQKDNEVKTEVKKEGKE